MKRFLNKFWKDCRGSVMMEYIVLNYFFITALVISGYFFINPYGMPAAKDTYRIDPYTGEFIVTTSETGGGKDFGILGDAFIKRYNLMLQVVSMPYP